MQITDTIADLLTRIRNASTAKHATVDVPASNMKKSITQILVDEGYVKDFKIIEDGKQGIIRITLKYDENRNPVRTQKSIKAWSENLRKLRGYAKGYKGSWHCYRIYFKGRYHRQEG